MMRIALIGNPVAHSLSPLLFSAMGEELYELVPIATSQELERFVKDAHFDAWNVTSPWKQAIVPFLDETDSQAVNCVVRRGGRILGTNTDVAGVASTIARLGSVRGAHVGIFGRGGAAYAAERACYEAGAAKVSMMVGIEAPLASVDWLIQATPLGMAPLSKTGVPAEEFFQQMAERVRSGICVFDMIYAPNHTPFLKAMRTKTKNALGGRLMLVAQAHASFRFMLGGEPCFSEDALLRILETRSVFFCGFMGAGKTTLAQLIAEQIGWEFVDCDALLEKELGPILDLFADGKEALFRAHEAELVTSFLGSEKKLIALGGGALDDLRAQQIAKKHRCIFLDASFETLQKRAKLKARPLMPSRELYEKRLAWYHKAGRCIHTDGEEAETSAKKILEMYF